MLLWIHTSLRVLPFSKASTLSKPMKLQTYRKKGSPDKLQKLKFVSKIARNIVEKKEKMLPAPFPKL